MENQQLTEIVAWLKSNAVYLVLFVVLSVGGSVGWNYWKHKELSHKQAASNLYDQVQRLSADEQLDEARAKLTELEKDFADTGYPFLGNLVFAKQAYQMEKNVLAEQALKWVFEQAKEEIFIQLSAERLGRVYLDNKEIEKAKTIVEQALGKLTNESALATLNMIYGDIYIELKKPKLAIELYNTAKKNLPENSPLKELINMKLNNYSRM